MGLVEKYDKVFKFPGREDRRRRFIRALKRSSFDYFVLVPYLPQPLTIEFTDSMGNFGRFVAAKHKLRLLDGLNGSMLATIVHHELFHALDCYMLTYQERLKIWAAFHPDKPPTAAMNLPGWKDRSTPTRSEDDWGWLSYGIRDNNPDWWDKNLGEISAEAFTMAYGVVPLWNDDDAHHVVNDEVLATIRSVVER